MLKREKILAIEDEEDILEVIAYNLKREGYRVTACTDGGEGLDRVRRESPDLILLDLMLPGTDGVEVCRQLKSDPTTRKIPVIMVTAKGEECDVVLGLGVGADDYIVKPFSPKELIARIGAVLRRGSLRDEGADRKLVVGDVTIDIARHEVHVGKKLTLLTSTEFRLLHFLASHPGRVFTRDHLLSRVVGNDAVVVDRNIDVHIRAIRRKLGPRWNFIETVRGVGYRCRDAEA